MGNSARLSDLGKVHSDLVALEDGTNRTIRVLNRNLGQLSNRVTEIESETNTGFAAVAKRIDTLGEAFDELKHEFETRANMEFDELNRSSGANCFAVNPFNRELPRPNFMRHPEFQPDRQQQQLMDFEDDEDERVIRENQIRQGGNLINPPNQDCDGQNHAVRIMAADSSNGQGPGNFNGEPAAAFDTWVVKFRDFLDVFGKDWIEEDKLARLKLNLGEQARRLFGDLPRDE